MKSNKKTRKKTQRAAIKHAGPATEQPKNIKALSLDIRTRLEAADKEAALANYEIGQMVNEAADDPVAYGLPSDAPVVKLIAEEVGYQKDTIYNGARVAKAWPRQDFTAWRMRKGKDGRILSFAHFVEAVKVDDAKERDAALERALTEGLSTRELRKHCRKSRREGGKPARRVSGARLLESIIRLSEKCKTLFGQLPDALPVFDGTGVTDPAGLIDRAQEAQHQVKELCEGNAKLLASRFEELKRKEDDRKEETHVADVVPLAFLGASKVDSAPSVAGGAA